MRKLRRPNLRRDGALVTGDKLRKIVEATPFPIDGVVIRTTISVGVASLDSHMSEATTLYELADAALYQAKSNGRNRVEAG